MIFLGMSHLSVVSYVLCYCVLYGTAGIGVDLEQSSWVDQLVSAGFNAAAPTCWVAEGLLYYLNSAAVDNLLKVSVLPRRML